MEDPFDLSGPAPNTSLDDPFGDAFGQPPVTPTQPPATTSANSPHITEQPESGVFNELPTTSTPSDSQSNNQLFDFLASESSPTPPKTEAVQFSGDMFDFFSTPVVSTPAVASNPPGDLFDGFFSPTPSAQPPASTPSTNFGDLFGDLTPLSSAPQPAPSHAASLFDMQPADLQPSEPTSTPVNPGPSSSLDMFSLDALQPVVATSAPTEPDLFGAEPSTVPVANPAAEIVIEESQPAPAPVKEPEPDAAVDLALDELPEATRARAGTLYIPLPETHAPEEPSPTVVVAPTPSGPNQAAITALAHLPHRAGSLKDFDEHLHIEPTDSPILNLDDSIPSLTRIPSEATLERAIELPAEPEPQPQRLNREATLYIALPTAAEGGVPVEQPR